MSAISVNKNKFQSRGFELGQARPDRFLGSWCGPCRMVVPLVEEIAKSAPISRLLKLMWMRNRNWLCSSV